jgi:hypothetical protein
VLRLLHDRAVLGEFTPCQMVNGKGTPTNKVKADYFPPIVEEAVFHRVQAGLESRRTGGGGSKGAVVTNLFSKVVFCGRCGAPVHLINKGQPRGSRSLVCEGSKRGFTACSPSYWPIREFERNAITFLRDKIDIAALTGDAVNRQEREEADREVRSTEGRLAETKLQRDRAFDLVTGNEPTDFLRTRLRDLDAEVARLEKQLATLRHALNAMTRETTAFVKGKEEIAQLIDQLQSGAEDTFALRAALVARIRDLVKKIFVWPSPVRITIGAAGKITTAHAARCFTVVFKNDLSRLVAPTDDDPARVIDTGSGRVVGGDAGVREELVRRFGAEPAAWEDVCLIEPSVIGKGS